MHEIEPRVVPPMPNWEELASELRSHPPRPPLQQDAFELSAESLWRQIEDPSLGVLLNYHTDLGLVAEVDADLMRYLLPRSMRAWQLALLGSQPARECVGELHASLSHHPNLIREVLGDAAQHAVEDFALQTLEAYVSDTATLSRPSLGWVPHWAGLSCGLPDLAMNWWDRMRRSTSEGLAAAIVTYLTRITYRPMHNPLFPEDYRGPEPWARLTYITGGARWQQPIVEAFRTRLDPGVVGSVLAEASDLVRPAEREICALLVDDFPGQIPSYSGRLEEVLANLAAPDPSDYWTDLYAP